MDDAVLVPTDRTGLAVVSGADRGGTDTVFASIGESRLVGAAVFDRLSETRPAFRRRVSKRCS